VTCQASLSACKCVLASDVRALKLKETIDFFLKHIHKLFKQPIFNTTQYNKSKP